MDKVGACATTDTLNGGVKRGGILPVYWVITLNECSKAGSVRMCDGAKEIWGKGNH